MKIGKLSINFNPTKAIILSAFIVAPWAKAIPPWASSNTQIRIGDIYRVVCSGDGPAIDIARREATNSCMIDASRQLNRNTKIRSMTIETEKEAAFHQEVNEDVNVSNLQCNPIKESIEQQSDRRFIVWLHCEFDISIVGIELDEKPRDQALNSEATRMKEELKQVKSIRKGNVKNQNKVIVSTAKKALNIATIPSCSEILIRGINPRIVKCIHNPIGIVVDDSDDEAIVRADGFVPKSINLKLLLKENSHAPIQVILDPL